MLKEIIEMQEGKKIEKGDVIQLKSGGPEMTAVSDAYKSGDDWYVRCTWFEGAKRHSDNFIVESLVHTETY